MRPRDTPRAAAARPAKLAAGAGSDATRALEALAELLDERLRALPLTPAERAEALCIALGIDCAVSAAARGVSTGAVRTSRRRLRRKLARAL